MRNTRDPKSRRKTRREFLIESAGGALAAGAFGAYPMRGCAAEPVNIGGLYPVTGSWRRSGQVASTPPNSRCRW